MSGNCTPTKHIGGINTLEDGRFQWTIDDFLSQVSNDIRENSPDFNFLDRSYNIYLRYNKNGMIIILAPSHVSPMRRLRVELTLGTGSISVSQTHSGETDERGYFSTVVWMPSSKCTSRRLQIIHEGRFTLLCNLRCLHSEEIASAPRERLSVIEKMQEDFKNLLTSGEDSDVTIKVQGKEFPAHKNILRARSPVFKSMFSHEMMEKQSGVVAIDDCDPADFPDFLNYVYTGSTKHICDGNVFSLYTASDKYGVEELKEECAAFMKGNLSVGTFCDVITLALRHGEKELVDLATGFFCAKATEIVKTAKWQTFLHENSTMGNELFIIALSNKNNI